jgi:phenylalanyl-tRNA synthetase beta chain
MDIKITDKALRLFLDTPCLPEKLANDISLCGATIDRVKKIGSDYVYDIEIITNRIDTVSAQGLARDSAAILNQMGVKSTFKNDPYREKTNLYPNLPKPFSFSVSDSNLITRFTAVSLENITISDSPKDTQNLLTLCGERPINNAVDITNELTIMYGMPSHIFDLDKLAPQKLTIRESKRGETVVTLDNQKNVLQGGDIIIEDGAGRNVDLCGVMGGAVAEVDKHTKNILLIVPAYDPQRVRKTSLYLQKRTLAVQIYEKQPDPELCLPVLMKAIKLFNERTGARVSSSVYDNYPRPFSPKKISLDTQWATKLIGVTIPLNTTVSILENLGFAIDKSDSQKIICVVPSWRQFDINIKEDLIEEIARVYGYSNLPPRLPCVNLPPEPVNGLLKTESQIKNFLSCQVFNEVYNYSLISEAQIVSSELSVANHLKLKNSLSTDFLYLRTSLVPSILQNIKNNQGKSTEPYNLFELSNVYIPTAAKLPDEKSKLVMAQTSDFLHAKGYVETLLDHLNLKKRQFEVSKDAPPYFLSSCTAKISSKGKLLGFIGTIKPKILHNLGVTSNPIIVELDTQNIADSRSENYVYKPISEFPEVVEQITILSKLKVGDIIEKIETVSPLINSVTYSDSYNNNHTFRITFSSSKNNLTQTEVNKIKESIQELFKN